jgi:hypothetical protein
MAAQRFGLERLQPGAQIRLKPASARESDTKPSADMSSWKPRWRFANSAEATGSATLRERAEAVMVENTVRCIAYAVQNTMRARDA